MIAGNAKRDYMCRKYGRQKNAQHIDDRREAHKVGWVYIPSIKPLRLRTVHHGSRGEKQLLTTEEAHKHSLCPERLYAGGGLTSYFDGAAQFIGPVYYSRLCVQQ